MGLSGGGDRSELRPLRPDGNVDHDLSEDVVVGNHKGNFSGYNIVNPRPGTVHQYGNRSDVLSARQRGWWVADPEVDGRPAYAMMEQYLSDSGTPLATGDSAYSQMVHLVTSEENYRRLQEEHQAAAKAQLGPAGLGFLEGATAAEQELGRSGERMRATRFATRDHGTFTTDESGRVLESLTPKGILREEDL